MVKLVIVESNAKCKKMKDFLVMDINVLHHLDIWNQFSNGLKSNKQMNKNYTPS